ncbi:MAG: L,D-transpeptidase family protein [Bacteroidales bacterium]|nr:L,D-transpeptidase family protein [Bacteroidales bacterium]
MKKSSFFILVIVLSFLLVLVFLIFSLKEPPSKEITRARKSLAAAESIHSGLYASELFKEANMNYDSAMIKWKMENEKFIFFRDYKKVRENAIKANLLAERAVSETQKRFAIAEENLGVKISQIKTLLLEFETKYNNFPFDSKHRADLAHGKLLLNEGISAFEKRNYLLSESKLDAAEKRIKNLDEIYKARMAEYFMDYPLWKKWTDQSVSNSKKHSTYCIIIDKISRVCILYKNGKVVQKWDIELGANWLGDKNQQGDKSTPEGFYKIVSKKANGNSSYHKALLLNYPNEEDKKRFLENKKKGIIGKDAKIGNMIEIHGNGGHGFDWTDGCVALEDSDMDKLYAACQVGTPVTIVGSVKPLDELFSEEK